MNFLSWYKNRIESNKLEPPEFIWENIQDDLDINQSWYVINNSLSQKSAARRISIFALAASFLILISIGSYWFLKPDVKQREFQSLVKKVTELENEILYPGTIINERLITEGKPENKTNPQNLNNHNAFLKESLISETIINDNHEEYSKENTTNRLFYAKLNSKTVLVDYDINREIVVEESKTMNKKLEKDTHERIAFRKYYLGSTGQLANTWLLNDKTYRGLESSSLTSSNASFGSNFGIFIGTNISKKIDLQLDINLLAQNKQDYNEYANGHYVSNTMKFNYSQLALSFRYNFIGKRFIKGEHGVNLGSYLGYLHNAYQVIDGETISLKDNYTTFDYGFFAAYEYIIPISNKLGLGTGLKAYYGLKNIYSGDGFIPAYMNKTNNASVNISFSFKYSFK